MPLLSGTRLGPYEIVAPLGSGGMGEVYRAHDTRLGRDVAIKVLPQNLAATPEVRARFEREARTISQLNHPHICALFDVGHQDGTDYLVMELIDGETLAQRLTKGELTVGQTVVIDFQLAVGASTQIVEINTDAPLIESERTQQANTIDQMAVRNLPINRRDYLTFALLAPGISDSKALADSNSFRVKQTPDSGLSFYGGNGRGNSITVDGGEANDSGGGVRTTGSPVSGSTTVSIL